jgi:hypothetical protein
MTYAQKYVTDSLNSESRQAGEEQAINGTEPEISVTT